MNVFPRQYILIERPSDRRGKYVWIIDRIALRVAVKHVEECVEVVFRLINMHDRDGSIGPQARPQHFDRRPHGSKGVLSLRGSIIGNDDRSIACVKRDVLGRLLQEWQRQTSTTCR